MKIFIRKSAIKDLNKIDPDKRNLIHDSILKLTDFPNVANIKKLTNFEPAFRLRTGDYRVLFDIIDNTIFIGRVLHRKESYKK